MADVGIEAAMLELNALGGDSDTIGSIAGQIFGVATAVDASDLLADVAGAPKVIDVAHRFAKHAFDAGEAVAAERRRKR